MNIRTIIQQLAKAMLVYAGSENEALNQARTPPGQSWGAQRSGRDVANAWNFSDTPADRGQGLTPETPVNVRSNFLNYGAKGATGPQNIESAAQPQKQDWQGRLTQDREIIRPGATVTQSGTFARNPLAPQSVQNPVTEPGPGVGTFRQEFLKVSPAEAHPSRISGICQALGIEHRNR